MSLNEILLIIGVISVLIVPQLLLSRIKQPLHTYIRLGSGLLLLILVWFFSNDASWPIKVFMTTVVVSSAIKTMKDYVDSSRHASATGENKE